MGQMETLIVISVWDSLSFLVIFLIIEKYFLRASYRSLAKSDEPPSVQGALLYTQLLESPAKRKLDVGQ